MIATNFLSRLSRGLALAALLMAVTVGTTYAQETYFVSNDAGSDAFNGQSPNPQADGTTGPFATINQAIAVAEDGDTILIEADDQPYSNGTDEAVGDEVLTFGVFIDDDVNELVAEVDDGFSVTDGSITIIDNGSGTLQIDDNLTVGDGTFTAADGVVTIGSGTSITLGDGDITGDLDFAGQVFVTYNGTTDVTAGPELPNDLQGGDLTVGNGTDAITLTFDQTLGVDDLFLNGGSAANGVFSFTAGGTPDVHQIVGEGSFGSAVVSADVTAISSGDGLTFTGALTISIGDFIIAAGSDVSPAGDDAVLRINIAAGGMLVATGTFNADQNPFSFDITTPENGGSGGVTYTTSITSSIDLINDFTISANDVVVNASSFTTTDVDGDGVVDINDDLLVENGDDPTSATTTETAELILPTGAITVSGTVTVQDNAILDVNGGTLTLVANATVNGEIEDGLGGGSLALDDADILGGGDSDIIGFTVLEAETSVVEGVETVNGSITTEEDSELFLTLAPQPDPVDPDAEVEGDITGSLTLNGDVFQLGADATITGDVTHNSGSFEFGDFDLTLAGTGTSNFVANVTDDSGIVYTAGSGALVIDATGNFIDTDSTAIPNVVQNESVTLGDGAGEEGDVVVSESFVQVSDGFTNVIGTAGESLTVSGTLLLQSDPFVSGGGVLILDGVDVTLNEPDDPNAEVRNSRIRFEGDVSISTAQDDDGEQVLDLVSLGTLQHRGGEVSIGANSFLVANTGVAVTGGSVTGDGDFEIRGGDVTLAADYSVAHLRIDPGAATVTVVEDPAAADSPDRTLTVPTVLWLETGVLDVDLATLVVADGATIHREAGELAVTTDADPDTEDGSIVLGEMLAVLYGEDGGPITTGLELPDELATINVQADVVLDQNTTVNNTLQVADTLSANDDADGNDFQVSLADGAELILEGDGGIDASTSINELGSFDLTYLDYTSSDVITEQEFPEDAEVDTLTIDLDADEVGAGADSLALDQERTINNVVLADGVFNLDAFELSISEDLTYQAGVLASTGSDAQTRVIFVGSSESEFATGGGVTLPENVNIELSKDGITHVDVTGGDLNFATTDSTAAILYLNGGLLHVEGDNHVMLFQSSITDENLNVSNEPIDQGFWSEDEIDLDSSYVVGMVRKSIENSPGTNRFAGLVVFPVGDTTGSYSPFRYTFDTQVNQGVIFGTEATVEFNLGHPDGSNGFPLTATTDNGTDYMINGYEDFYWSVVSTADVSDDASYDAEGVRTGYENDSTSTDRLRLVRRAGTVENESNEWTIAGESYANFEVDNETHVVAQDASGGISRAGSLYSFGTTEGEQVDITTPSPLPAKFALNGNFPNPFRASTTISFDLPKPAAVDVQVIDILGRTVRTISAGTVEAGAEHKIQIDASGLSSGVYFYRITAELGDQTKVETGKMTLVK